MKNLKLTAIAMVAFSLFAASCSKDDNPTPGELDNYVLTGNISFEDDNSRMVYQKLGKTFLWETTDAINLFDENGGAITVSNSHPKLGGSSSATFELGQISAIPKYITFSTSTKSTEIDIDPSVASSYSAQGVHGLPVLAWGNVANGTFSMSHKLSYLYIESAGFSMSAYKGQASVNQVSGIVSYNQSTQIDVNIAAGKVYPILPNTQVIIKKDGRSQTLDVKAGRFYTLEADGDVDADIIALIKGVYPNASNFENNGQRDVLTNGGTISYTLVSFNSGNQGSQKPSHGWFENKHWSMYEEDIPFNMLPTAVQNAFKASEYATWQIDDIEILKRRGLETKYSIEVEQANVEVDLYYSETGILLQTITDAGNNDNSGSLPPQYGNNNTTITSYVTANYPNARIVEIEYEGSIIEVEILHENHVKELFFNSSSQWQYSKWEVRQNELPAAVSSALAASTYSTYYVDDIDYYENSSNEKYYLLELKSQGGEVKVKITLDGTLTVVQGGGNGSGNNNGSNSSGINATALALINQNYPGAVIKEYDYEDGYYEVEIMHNNKEKSVYFNQVTFAWVKTEYDVRWSEVPAAVKTAIQNSSYSAYNVEGADFVETPTNSYYLVELENEQTDREVKLKITASGQIL